MDAELIQETYSKLSTGELLEIVSTKEHYTQTAIEIALAELKQRGVSESEITRHNQLYEEIIAPLSRKNITDDISFYQKMYLYFLWLPIFKSILPDFTTDRQLLKSRQTTYYQFFGFVGFLLTASIASASSTAESTIAAWIVVFLLAFGFDKLYNLERQKRRLRRLEQEGRLDLEW